MAESFPCQIHWRRKQIQLCNDATNPIYQSELVFLNQLMLPNPYYPPSSTSQHAVDDAVSSSVACELCQPKRAIAVRAGGVLRAAMPKASVHKQSYMRFQKYKIRVAKNWIMASPPADAILPKQSNQSNLSCKVATTLYTRHYFGTFSFREHVHWLTTQAGFPLYDLLLPSCHRIQ